MLNAPTVRDMWRPIVLAPEEVNSRRKEKKGLKVKARTIKVEAKQGKDSKAGANTSQGRAQGQEWRQCKSILKQSGWHGNSKGGRQR